MSRLGESRSAPMPAPAVMRSVKMNDPDVGESAIHIKEALGARKPGKFISRGDGTILESSEATALERLRSEPERRENRRLSKNQCIAQYGKVSGQCTFTGDPDEEPSACDCDEYPFAAAHQGAASGNFSVKRVDSGDNRRAGARFGCFLASQRVLDGEKFYIDAIRCRTRGRTASRRCSMRKSSRPFLLGGAILRPVAISIFCVWIRRATLPSPIAPYPSRSISSTNPILRRSLRQRNLQ